MMAGFWPREKAFSEKRKQPDALVNMITHTIVDSVKRVPFVSSLVES